MTSPPPPTASLVRRVFRNVGGKLKTSLAAVGLVTTLSLAAEYRRLKALQRSDEEKENGVEPEKKRVLVIPFHRLHFMEHRSQQSWMTSVEDWRPGPHNEPMNVETKELVKVLHSAASDPTIVSLYGYFGHGSVLGSAGWADLEEVRNALMVVRQSHRQHLEPNFQHKAQIIPRIASKPLYAYADTFVSMTDTSNKDYFLASAFTHIHLQRRGEWNLLGLSMQQIFLRGLLEQNGILVHVVKHGQYKNMPNMFTDYGFNKAHRENATDLVETLDADMCRDMTASRSKRSSSRDMFQQFHNVGTLSALQAWKQGLVDYLPRRDPLPDLVASNQSEENKALQKMAWKLDETDFESFTASQTVTLPQYVKELRLQQKSRDRLEHLHQYGAKYPLFGRLLSLVGLGATNSDTPTEPVERISVIHLGGNIDHSAASQTVHTIRKIKKQGDSVKAVVLRVNSRGGIVQPCNTIAQELKSLSVPLIVSFGDAAASGGYLVAADADRIFALNKTITGSIGVFGIRPDATQLAARYGVTAQTVSTGSLARWNDPLTPMTRPMKQAFSESIDRYYEQFKQIVAHGRDLDDEYVESVAQGRVFTGNQAKTNGLVDEIGGLDRAIAYAKRNFTARPDDVKVEVWPKERKFWDFLFDSSQDSSLLFAAVSAYLRGEQIEGTCEADYTQQGMQSIADWVVRSSTSGGFPGTLSGVMLASDENTAIRCFLDQVSGRAPARRPNSFPSWFWE